MKTMICLTTFILLIGHANAIFCEVHEVEDCQSGATVGQQQSQYRNALQSMLNGIDCHKSQDIYYKGKRNEYFNGQCNKFGESFDIMYYDKQRGIDCFGFDKVSTTTIYPCQCTELLTYGGRYRVAFGDTKTCKDRALEGSQSYSSSDGEAGGEAGGIVGAIVGICCCIGCFFIIKKFCQDSEDNTQIHHEDPEKQEEPSEKKPSKVSSPTNEMQQMNANNQTLQPMMQQPMMQQPMMQQPMMQPGMMPANPMMMQQQPMMQPMMDPMTGMPMQPVMQPMMDPMTGMPMQPVMQPMIDPMTGMPMQPMVDPMTGLPMQQPGMQPGMMPPQ